MKRPQVDRRYYWAALGGLLTTMAQPSLELTLLAWSGPALLLVAVYQTPFRTSWRVGACFGMTHFLTLLHWIAPTLHTYAPMPLPLALSSLGLLAVYLSVFMALLAAGTAWLCHTPLRLLIGAPILWVVQEFARARLLTGFPWGLLGYSQYKWLPMIQIAEITGPYGVSAIIMLANAVLALLLLKWTAAPPMHPLPTWRGLCLMVLAALGMVGAVLGGGHIRQTGLTRQLAQAPSMAVAVVQGNIDQTRKWAPDNRQATLDTYFLLSAETVRPDNKAPDLVVWPETALPFYLTHDRSWVVKVQDGVRRMGSALLTGGPAAEDMAGGYRYFNSAFLIDPQGHITGRYDKRHLVPFGEYVPFKNFLFFLNKLVTAAGDFSTGIDHGNLVHRGVPINTLICYEIIFPHLVRQHPRAGLIVNITNDAWFGESGGPHQHFSTAVFRAVENRCSVARAANTGISGFVLPTGEIRQATALNLPAVETRRLPLSTQASFYNRYGDLFAWICTLLTLLASVVQTIGQKRRAHP